MPDPAPERPCEPVRQEESALEREARSVREKLGLDPVHASAGEVERAIENLQKVLTDEGRQVRRMIGYSPDTESRAVLDTLRNLWDEGTQVRQLLQLGPHDGIADVLERIQERQNLAGIWQRIRAELGMARNTEWEAVFDKIKRICDALENERTNRLALTSETSDVRDVLGLPQAASATEVLDRLREWKRRADDHRSTLLGLAVGLGMDGEPTGNQIGIRLAQVQALLEQVREALGVADGKGLSGVFQAARQAGQDSVTLRHIRAHLRLQGDAHRQDVEQSVAVLQAHTDSVRDHLFLPREVESWMVTKTIKDMREGLLDSIRYSRPPVMVIPFESLSPEAQERLRKQVEAVPFGSLSHEPPAEREHVRALAAALKLDEGASAEWVVEVLLDRLRGVLGLDSTPPTEGSAEEALRLLEERLTGSMVDHVPQPGITYQVILESSGERGFSLYDVRSATFLDRTITRQQVMTRLCMLVHPAEWKVVSRHLTRIFDAEQLNVHIGAKLRDDLQVSASSQLTTAKALVTLELVPGLADLPPDTKDSDDDD